MQGHAFSIDGIFRGCSALPGDKTYVALEGALENKLLSHVGYLVIEMLDRVSIVDLVELLGYFVVEIEPSRRAPQ